jgi:hypothetical protein
VAHLHQRPIRTFVDLHGGADDAEGEARALIVLAAGAALFAATVADPDDAQDLRGRVETILLSRVTTGRAGGTGRTGRRSP